MYFSEFVHSRIFTCTKSCLYKLFIYKMRPSLTHLIKVYFRNPERIFYSVEAELNILAETRILSKQLKSGVNDR